MSKEEKLNIDENTDYILTFKDTNNRVHFNFKKGEFFYQNSNASHKDIIRFLKMKYPTFKVLKEKFFRNRFDEFMSVSYYAEYMDKFKEVLKELEETYENVKPFTYREAFELSQNNDPFAADLFDTMNVGEMIKNLGHEMISVDGKNLTQKRYDKDGRITGTYELHNVYEVHKVNGEKLNVREDLYAVKCWCTSTDTEHWLWIENNPEYIENPLKAIASTFRIHKSVIPHIKALKRQGDILLVEMKNDFTPKADDEIVPLTPEEYFGLLEAQS